jgi:hypothetical protein
VLVLVLVPVPVWESAEQPLTGADLARVQGARSCTRCMSNVDLGTKAAHVQVEPCGAEAQQAWKFFFF